MIHYGTPRKTEIAAGTTPKKWAPWMQRDLEFMWQIIEGDEENWRMTYDNTSTYVLDEERMVRLFADNGDDAYEAFDASEEHSPEAGAWEWHNLPDHLLGTYTIKGQYSGLGYFIPEGNITYHFSEVY